MYNVDDELSLFFRNDKTLEKTPVSNHFKFVGCLNMKAKYISAIRWLTINFITALKSSSQTPVDLLWIPSFKDNNGKDVLTSGFKIRHHFIQ